MNHKNLYFIKFILGLLLLLPLKASFAQKINKRPNVLFIFVDDLRPELNCYGKTQIKSPYIDKLASRGMLFNNAFCNIPVCGASRASILSGVRGSAKRFTVAETSIDKDLPGHLSLPRYLKQNGYTTISLGKVYHIQDDDANAWSVPPTTVYTAFSGNYMNPENVSRSAMSDEEKKEGKRGPAFEMGREKDDFKYRDGLLAKKAIGVLDTLSNAEKPFFLAVGFFKPHLPFVAPKKYFDMYKREDIVLANNQYIPKGAPDIALTNSGELRQHYSGVPKDRILPDDYAVSMRHAYYASITYVDAMIGEVLKKLEDTGLDKNTIVVLIGDHGWNLGEHTIWGKHNTFETALRTPLIVSAPKGVKDKVSQSMVEFVDIYPTLTALCGLKTPEHCQGVSFTKILQNPEAKTKDEVYCRWRTGEGIHTQNYSYTEWFDPKSKQYIRMLYDLNKDPDENVNIAGLRENQSVVEELSKKIRQNIIDREKL